MKAVILAGGSGTRLWPLSRQKQPKQFASVIGNVSLIRDTFRRLSRAFALEDIYFSVSPEFAEYIFNEFPEIKEKQVIIEPDRRDTGPAMGYVAAFLESEFPDEPMVFVPSDHYIRDEDAFLDCIMKAFQIIESTGALVDIGITPSFPSTVLGYTKISELYKELDGIEIYNFAGHTEKPSYDIAKSYLDDGKYLWHANYYSWTPRKFMESFDKYSPEIGRGLRDIQKELKENDAEKVGSIYKNFPKISFDYAVTENLDSDDVYIIKGNFGWSDIGAWDTLYDRLSEKKDNVIKGKCILIETSDSLVYGCQDKVTAVIGIKDLIIVDTEDALLVCTKDNAQRVKEVVEYLKENNHNEVL